MTPGAAPAVFLPGLVMPADLRYAALFHELGDARALIAQDLAVATASSGYSMEAEIRALDDLARARGIDRFHLYGHSAGGAVALAYAAARPERILSLALDEPATDFSDEDLRRPEWSEMRRVRELSFEDGMVLFRRLQVGSDVSPALPPVTPRWMRAGPQRIAAFSRAVTAHRVAPQRYARFGGPVLYTYGTLTAPRFAETAARLVGAFGALETVRYDGLHHLHSGHQDRPAAVARSLGRLWERAEHQG